MRPADDRIGRDADAAQLAHGMLRRLGLQLVGGAEVRYEREMDVHDVLFADVVTHLADRFKKRQRLDIAHRASDLHDADVGVARLRDVLDVRLDLVGDVRDDLNRRAQVVAAAFFFDDGVVDLAGRDVVRALQILVDETLVVTEIEVGLGAVLGNENLAVLIRVHRARVDVDVGVELLDRNADAARFEQPSERCGRDALSERTHDAAGEEYVLRHLGMWQFRAGARNSLGVR